MSNESSQSYDSPTNEAVMARLLELENKTGYRMQQCNGQRKYWNPNWTGSPPPRGSEVFVGKIPRDLFEDELVPVFERVGKIYELRLMMDFSGYNRGYAFVTYNAKEEAIRAIEQLDNYEIRPGMKIGVCRSVDNCRLFVGSIPKDKSQEEIRQAMCEVTEDVNDVIVYPGTNPGEKNRGFAFVEYSSHRAAAMARRKLIPGRITLFGYEVAVDWADPESDVNDDMMNRVKNVYVRNLKATTSEFTIWAAFNNIRPGSIERVKKIEDRDFAFVHFHKREDALYAVQVMNGQVIDGQDVHVSLAKPNAMTKQTLGMKGYGSVQNMPGKFSSGNVSEPLFNSGGLMVNRTPMGMNSSQAFDTSMGAPGGSSLTMGTNDMGPMCTLRGFQNRPRSATPLQQYSMPQRVATPTAQMFPTSQGNYGWKAGIPVAAQRKLRPAVTMDHIANIKCPVILLNELCVRVNLGCAPPQYVLYIDEQTTGGTEQNGKPTTKYVYQVVFAGAIHTPPFSCDTIEEAKRAAAQHVLNRIGPWMKSKLDSCIMRTNSTASAPGLARVGASNGVFSSSPLGKATMDRAEQGGLLDNTNPFTPGFGANMPTLSQYQSMGSFLGQQSGSIPMQQ